MLVCSIINLISYLTISMSNPFEYFTNNDSDDEKYQTTPNDQKPKRTHAEKRVYKQQQTTTQKPATGNQPVLTEQYP